MSLQTLTFNCLACHILAKHPQFAKKNKANNLTLIKALSVPSKAKPSLALENKQPSQSKQPITNHRLKKIA